MSTLKANNIQHLDSSSANIQTTQGGGTILTGVSTIGNANLIVESNASEGVRIDSSGNVGIGTDNPTQKLEIDNVTGGASLLIRTSPSTSGGNLLFGDDASDTSGRVSYVHSSDHMYFSTNGGERLRITASGAIGIGTDDPQDELHVMGQVRISQESDVTQRLRITHQGIDFQNTGAGSSTTSTSHLLDDYEEGTWTPTYAPQTGAFTSITYDAVVQAFYTKIGGVCYIRGFIRTDALDTTGASGNVQIRGMPFTAKSGAGVNQTITIGNSSSFSGEVPTSALITGLSINLYYRSTADGDNSILDVSDLGTGANNNGVFFSGVYEVA